MPEFVAGVSIFLPKNIYFRIIICNFATLTLNLQIIILYEKKIFQSLFWVPIPRDICLNDIDVVLERGGA